VKYLLLKHIIRPWYFAGFATFLALFITIISILIINELKNNLYNIRYLNDKIKEDVMVTERDNQLKVIAMYNLIISTYGNKYHKRYNVGKKRKYQGLEPRWQAPLFNRKSYDYEKRLNIPYMTFHTFAKIETAFNPYAETKREITVKKGRKETKKALILEAGIFQHREEAVGQALLFNKQMRSIHPNLAEELEFKFNKMGDLFDPINALRVQANLVWGYMQKTANQMAWWSTLTHWGWGRIAGYYYFRKNKGILPDDFTFNKGTVKEDTRDPLQYFGLFFANWGQFSKFRIRVGVEQWYDKLYKQECSRLEWQFIQSWKFVKDLKEDVQDFKKFRLETKIEHEKRLKKILSKAANIDREYAKLHGIIKSGRFTKINNVFGMWRIHFKKLRDDLGYERKAKTKVGKKEVRFNKSLIIIYLIAMGLLFAFSIIGILSTIIIVIKKIKKSKTSKQQPI
jgi:hypothetical protein